MSSRNPDVSGESSAVALKSLALFGGKPAFDEPLHVGRPNIAPKARFLELVDQIFERRWLTNNGPCVQEFQKALCKKLDVEHCLVFCNATIALEIAIRALDLRGEVIIPSFTFVATAHALRWQEITPVFADIDPETHNLDPARVAAAISPRTTGIIGVHAWGRPCPIEPLLEIATHHKLKLIFDAAHALGCSHHGKMIGAFGDAEVFSFHGTKFLNSFEGGAIATNNSGLAKTLADMRNFGFAGIDKVTSVGTNGKMSEVSAAMGIANLEQIDEFIAANRRNYGIYREQLADLPGIKVISYDPAEKHNFQYIVIEVDAAVTGLSRNHIVEVLLAENVLARRYFYPGCHHMEPYWSEQPDSITRLPMTVELCERVISLPSGTSVSGEDVVRLCGIIRGALQHGREITTHLDHNGDG